MVINVIGKQHREGIGRTSGKPYNLNIIHYTCQEDGVEGYAAEQQALSAVDYPFETIKVGAQYNLDFSNKGYVQTFSPAAR